jgi:ParB-like chromosome segregation protein Spo0J
MTKSIQKSFGLEWDPHYTKFKVMPDPSPELYAEIMEDIKNRGVMVPVDYDEEGNILDGHIRVKICQELGIKEWPRIIRLFKTEAQKLHHAYQMNLLGRGR